MVTVVVAHDTSTNRRHAASDMVSVVPGVEAVNEPVFFSGEEAAMFEVDDLILAK